MVGINFAPGFLRAEYEVKSREAMAAVELIEDLTNWDKLEPAPRAKLVAEMEDGMAEYFKTAEPVDVKTVVDHIDHVVKITGSADTVGIGSDFDGIGATPKGLENVGKLGAITEELKARGYREEDIRKILGGNFLRVFNAVVNR